MPHIEIVGHRGAKGEAPENTVAGFTYTKSIGLTGVELDIRLPRDNELVVIHDATVDRTIDVSGTVSEMTAVEPAALDARSPCPEWPDPVGVPTLAPALDVVTTFATIKFEIKPHTPEQLGTITARPLREIRERSLERQSIVSSFDSVAVGILQRLAPEQRRAFLGRTDDLGIVQAALRLDCTEANLHRYRRPSGDLVAKAHPAGLRLGGGPCDAVEGLEFALAWSMDTVTTNGPSALLACLRAM